MLLHGAPGTGKTLAAEAIGYEVGKPLKVSACVCTRARVCVFVCMSRSVCVFVCMCGCVGVIGLHSVCNSKQQLCN